MLYACMHSHFMLDVHAPSSCIHAVHDFVLIGQRRMQPKHKAMYSVAHQVHAYLVQLSYGYHVVVNFVTSLPFS